jgi:hypothetical protein
MSFTNASICIAVDLCNATYGNAYQIRWCRHYQHLFRHSATHRYVAEGGVPVVVFVLLLTICVILYYIKIIYTFCLGKYASK